MSKIRKGQRFGKLTVEQLLPEGKVLCRCDCGNSSTPIKYNLMTGRTVTCGNCGKNIYRMMDDGKSIEVISTNGIPFYIDREDEGLVRQYKWHVTTSQSGIKTVMSSDRLYLHRILLGDVKGMEVDHIDLNRLNNRKSNLRVCTHQANQCNQPLQSNNTSGVSGVSYYAPRSKYRARIKIGQHDIHLGYYDSFEEAVQARNVGMECMFGEYGRYNDVPPAPSWIREKVIGQCSRFAELSPCRAFLLGEAEKERYDHDE